MTPHQALALAVRLFAILVAFYLARELLGFYVYGNERADPHVRWIATIVYVLAGLLLIVLWFFPRTIARGLLPLPADVQAQPSSSAETWFAVGSSLIGLWLMATAVPGLLRNSLFMFLFRSEPADVSGLISGLLYYAVQFLVGVGLILGANGIRKAAWWARNAGSN
jgi:hypothetical protein